MLDTGDKAPNFSAPQSDPEAEAEPGAKSAPAESPPESSRGSQVDTSA